MKRSLVLIISLVDIGSSQNDFLKAVHVVCNNGVEDRDLFTLILLCVDRFHYLKNLILLLNCQRGLMASVPFKEILDVGELEIYSKIHRVSSLGVF
jgi:hypothetical protein